MTWELRVGDCLAPVTGLASLPDKSVDHVICDPPYAEQTHAGARTSIDEKLVTFASIDEAGLRSVLSHVARVTRRWFVATMDWHHVAVLEKAAPAGLRFVRFGVWVKPNGAPQFTGDRPATGWEAVAILHAEPGKLRWNGGGDHAVWNVPKVNGDHPTQKPMPLLESFVRLFTDPGETILDPFAGSGTTGVAAIRLGRNFIGWERDPAFAETARKRLAATREQPQLPGMEPMPRKQLVIGGKP